MSRWLSLRRRKTRNRPNSVASSITKSFPKGLAFLSEPEDANVDIVFIHDLTQGRDEAWASVDPADGWPARLSEQGLDKARLVTFGYDVGDVQRIGELFDPSKLRESAEKLLHYYPLHTGWVSQANGATNGTAEAAVNGTNGVNGINGANGANGVNGHGDGHNEATAEEHAPAPVGIERPVIFVAHGFGGLIYEQAVALSFEKDQGVGKRRKHASVLLNTPHHGPGIAEWAVICAKELGIPCASSAQLEDWPPFEESIEKLRIIQRLFREAIRQKKSDLHITGAYGTLPTANKLKLASEWASLPDFESIAVEETHFGLTSLRADGEGFKKIASFIVKNASELSTAAADEASAEAAAAEERRLSETTFDRHRDAAAAIIALGLEATKPLAALFNSPQKHSKFMVAYVSKKLEYLLNAFEFLGLQLNKYEAASEERALEDLHLALETCRDSILKLQSETEDFGDISGTDQELQALSDQSGVLDSLIIPVVGDLRRGLDGILDKLLSVSPQTDSSEAALRKQFIKLRRESTHVQDLGARLSTYLPADKLLELEAKATEPSQTLLHCAARSGDVLAVEVLVDMGSNINSRDGEQQTPLHHASQRGDILTVGILLDRGASVEAQDVQGLRPLHLAASKGAGNVVELLLQKGADKDAPDSRARVPLHWAAENNHEAVVQQLIFAKASLGAGDKNARTSLHLAVEYQSEGVAQQLIRANAPIDALDRWSSTPLHIAAQKNSHAVIQQLFQAKASIDAKDQYQRTPLHWAAFRGFEKILTALLEKKADLEAVDSEGHTALQLAVIQGYAGIVQTLLGAGAVKEAQGTAGSVPLHEAISRGYIVLARMLLDDGADIEAKDKNGLTPLRAAMSRGQRDMVNLLVGKGANMDVKDN